MRNSQIVNCTPYFSPLGPDQLNTHAEDQNKLITGDPDTAEPQTMMAMVLTLKRQ